MDRSTQIKKFLKSTQSCDPSTRLSSKTDFLAFVDNIWTLVEIDLCWKFRINQNYMEKPEITQFCVVTTQKIPKHQARFLPRHNFEHKNTYECKQPKNLFQES
jgi:hypothetical protein